ncbi:Putative acyl-CoA dehydrogenase FadE17 [Zhongshania aliphaticivorans]|uniref:Acyl-CoA dehydrogenase FadE17 n=1 Tax=Zhongshania aliphaticivorans TaxID=1470434 RepID=A0A5S9MWQ8_9GAMM|nr:acyl-CoA dehydrogenase family protein [Zhongshania aliphaticivorans]CAA0081857.1 Putative acyl-CoA dehydrogenase FadE17 [Zhongshania aliphaticivorans]CAA0084619.1 Putative acyl-CoA dehydrogenase FadE17 [Zhongshania aliphaticivorans]
MNLSFSDEDLRFRDEVRDFFKTNFTSELAARIREPATLREATVEWQKILAKKGWVAPNWPVEHGGTNWSVAEEYLYEVERANAGAPDPVPFGLKMVAQVIIAYGNDEQKQRFLPRIYNSDDWWCQGYSEPGSGSDLASLKTRAVLEGDEYVVNGAKTWTTYAQYADWIFCLVRTSSDEVKQRGISFLLIDIKSPGITVKKIESIDGNHSLNEVIFDNVRVPVANRIGEQDKGWTYAKALLAHERTAIAGVGVSKFQLSELKEIARNEISGGKPLLEDAMIQHRFADIEIELMALEFTELRVLATLSGGGSPGPESSLLKIKGTQIQQAIQQLRMDLAGYYSGVLTGELSASDIGHSFGDKARQEYMYGRASTIYGGSNEIQKNITAKAVLGL